MTLKYGSSIMMHFFQVYECTIFKHISALFQKMKALINKFLYELIL